MMDPKLVWPDRFGVDIKTTDFLANIFRRLVAICLKRNAVPIGGMATALPDKNPEVNETASETIESDKEWEAKQGFLRAWVAHIFHMKAAADPFKNLRDMGWEPTRQMSDPNNYPVSLTVPNGPITIEGTRRNIRTIIEYVEGWMMGRGAKGIDSLEGNPGVHPRLMEDLATARISVAQTAQRILHRAKDSNTGEVHNFKLVKRLADEELDDILKRRENDSQFDMYRKSRKIALRWTKNYTDLNFRSLGSYTRTELNEISLERDAF
jgi:malate synthase